MAAKKCAVGHKGCSCPMVCCSVTPDRAAEIAKDARSGRNWAAETKMTPVGSYGPACLCGAGTRTYTAAVALQGVHGIPTGNCPRHSGGTLQRNPEGTRWPEENGN